MKRLVGVLLLIVTMTVLLVEQEALYSLFLLSTHVYDRSNFYLRSILPLFERMMLPMSLEWSCPIRKGPILIVRGTHQLLLTWEMACEMEAESVELLWCQKLPQRFCVHYRHTSVPLDFPPHTHHFGREFENFTVTPHGSSHFLYRVAISLEASIQHLKAQSSLVSGDGAEDGDFFAPNSTHFHHSNFGARFSYSLRFSHRGRHHATKFVDTGCLDSCTPTKYLIIGDNQFAATQFRRLMQNAQMHDVDYLVHVGDAVQKNMNRQWETDFFAVLGASGWPILYTQGNHDFGGKTDYLFRGEEAALSPPPFHVNAHNELGNPPIKTPSCPSAQKSWHAFTIEPVRWIVVDAMADCFEQDLWLESELSMEKSTFQPPVHFKIILVHIPPFLEYWNPTSWIQGNERSWGEFVRTRYVRLFEKYHVDLVLSGHQHNYAHGIRNSIHYVITGGGGGSLDKERVEDWEMYDRVELSHHFLLMVVERGSVEISMMDAHSGSMLDYFSLNNSALA